MSPLACLVYLIRASLSSPLRFRGIGPPPVPRTSTSFPVITVKQIVGVEEESLEGRSDLLMAICQVNCVDKSYQTAYSLRSAVKDAVMGFSDVISDVDVQAIHHVSDLETYDEGTKLWSLSVRLKLWVGFNVDAHPLDIPYDPLQWLDFPL